VALPVNIVPKPLIPFFKGGGFKVLMDLAEKYGPGLQLINAIMRMFPRDPSVPYDFYQQLTSWLNAFAREALEAGDYLNSLSARGLIDPSVLPKNFYLRRPDSTLCNYFFKVAYDTINTETGATYSVTRGFWQPDIGTAGFLKRSAIASIQEQLSAISSSVNAPGKYRVSPDSLQFLSAVRTC
jgi:hypothetical protein